MKRNIIATSIALGALALGATAPASADVFGFFDRFSSPTNVIDPIRGNDNRDAKDPTVLRNDVRFDEPMPGASAREPSNPAGQSWAEHNQVENIQRSPGPRDSSAETDSFEGARDTAAGVDSTRGSGGR